MQAQVDMLNEKYKAEIEQLSEGQAFTKIGLELTGSTKETESFEGAGENDITGYRYYSTEILEELGIEGLEKEYLVNIAKRKVIAIGGFEYEGEKYYSLEQITKIPQVGGLERNEYVTVDDIIYQKIGNKYKITLKDVKCSEYVGKYQVKYKEANDTEYTTVDTNIKDTNYSFIVDRYGLYYIQVIDAAEKTTERTEIILSIYDGITFETETEVTMVKTITDTGITTGKVTIPEGFTISGVDSECAQTILGVNSTNEKKYTIDDGVVMYLLNGESADWTSEAGLLTAQKTYDQFVWVPVKNPVLDLSGNETVLSTEASIKAAVQAEIDAGRYPMAIKRDETNYFGVLYQVSLDSEKKAVKVELLNDKSTLKNIWTPLWQTDSYNREPAYLTQSNYSDASSHNNVGITQTTLQNEFNIMVEKVSDNKGFWVGRYETSKIVSSNAQDSTNKIGVIKGTTEGINNVAWYRMYAQQKNYSTVVFGASTSLTSSMIWGSQWDQIMIWLKEVENTSKDSYYVVNSLTMGNLGTTDDSHSITSEPVKTADSESYKVKNIYDLAGNVCEWTLEAKNPDYRVVRRRRL